MRVVITGDIKLVATVLVLSVIISLLGKVISGGELARVTLAEGQVLTGEVACRDESRLWMEFDGDVTKLWRPFARKEVAGVAPFTPAEPRRADADRILREATTVPFDSTL